MHTYPSIPPTQDVTAIVNYTIVSTAITVDIGEADAVSTETLVLFPQTQADEVGRPVSCSIALIDGDECVAIGSNAHKVVETIAIDVNEVHPARWAVTCLTGFRCFSRPRSRHCHRLLRTTPAGRLGHARKVCQRTTGRGRIRQRC